MIHPLILFAILSILAIALSLAIAKAAKLRITSRDWMNIAIFVIGLTVLYTLAYYDNVQL